MAEMQKGIQEEIFLAVATGKCVVGGKVQGDVNDYFREGTQMFGRADRHTYYVKTVTVAVAVNSRKPLTTLGL